MTKMAISSGAINFDDLAIRAAVARKGGADAPSQTSFDSIFGERGKSRDDKEGGKVSSLLK